MNKRFFYAFFLISAFSVASFAQTKIPLPTLVKIVRAEDERRFDRDLQDLMKSPAAEIRTRAALAAGRIGNEKSIADLTALLEKEANQTARQTAAFALGEIESAKAADSILKLLQNENETPEIRAVAVEAAGKIAAANAKNEKSAALGEAILDVLEAEHLKQSRNRDVVLLGLTAALRARPEKADLAVAKFLTDKDERVRADAGNALARLRTKNANIAGQLRALLLSDQSPIVRANAARALGAAEDKDALTLLVEAAATDEDGRVRVSAIRAVANLKDKTAAAPLLERSEKLLADYKKAKPKFANPPEKNEILEIAAALGRLLQNSYNDRAIKFLQEFRIQDSAKSPEIEIAFARVAPKNYYQASGNPGGIKLLIEPASHFYWQTLANIGQGLGEIANLEIKDNSDFSKRDAEKWIRSLLEQAENERIVDRLKKYENIIPLALPDLIRAVAAFKPNDLNTFLTKYSKHKDVIVRATAAELLGEQPASAENIKALTDAFNKALVSDKNENDAQLAILSALIKSNKNEAVSSLKIALDAPDYLVRRHAAQLIKENGLTKEFPNVDEKVGTIKPYNPASRTKLGQILNAEPDYRRALSRRNGQVKAVLTTEKGAFTIEFFPEEAPLTVDNFVKLAKANYFNGLTVHRVVPNFVVQDGDPRGDGNGGPGWQIRDEINTIPYERGAVGMALSGKDTGGSQWFVTHSPQPHLEGGYTVFGSVSPTDMKVVDQIARGDRILSVRIIENASGSRSKNAKKD